MFGSKYSLVQLLSLSFDVLTTKLMFPKARLIRSPSDIRGKKYIKVSDGFTTGRGCRLEAYPLHNNKSVMRFGSNVQINDYVHITAMEEVVIGNNVLIASKVYISDCSHGSYAGNDNDSSPLSVPKERKYFTKPVIIEDNVWLGEFVSVLPGIRIGSGTIVGANSVVSRSLPSNVIAVGIPAVPIKMYNFETLRWEKIN
jgi:acetyltransferase-like isoleucine patch superfamily enzyme